MTWQLWLFAQVAGCALLPAALPEPGPGARGVGESAAAYQPDRRDYASFLEAQSDLLEPNYLPFMLHRFARDAVHGDALVFCHWAPEQMPIAVYIPPPRIGAALRDEFHPRRAAQYVEAAGEALDVWQNALEGAVRFERVQRRVPGALALQLIGEGAAPEVLPGRRRLGFAEGVLGACVAEGWDETAERMRVRFEPDSLRIYLADENGLLPPRVVRRLVIHELGHVLGMRGHSPSRGDVMYAELDAPVPGEDLSLQDVNSFLSLYRLPSGTLYADLSVEGQPPPLLPGPSSGPPMLSIAPYVDARLGFELYLPAGWLRFEEPHGVFAANGPSWDYDASLRLFVWPSERVEDFLECCTQSLLRASWLRSRQWSTAAGGRRTLEIVVEDASGERAHHYRFVELGDGRVLMIAAEFPVGFESAWVPWLRACLDSLVIWPDPERRPARAGDTLQEGGARRETPASEDADTAESETAD